VLDIVTVFVSTRSSVLNHALLMSLALRPVKFQMMLTTGILISGRRRSVSEAVQRA